MSYQWQFLDIYNNKVTLSFREHPFSSYPMHVWIICRYKDQWLLTRHSDRGLEFPGGKVEKGEEPSEAAIREVYEETGAKVDKLIYLAQYEVQGKSETIVKNVYFAPIQVIVNKTDYMETEGPVLLKQLPHNIRELEEYSFMMKDDVLIRCLERIKEKQLINGF